MKTKNKKSINSDSIVYGVGFLGSLVVLFIVFLFFLLVQDNFAGISAPHWVCFVGVVPVLLLSTFCLSGLIRSYFKNKK